jgi:parallel beta-helix repeat protein
VINNTCRNNDIFGGIYIRESDSNTFANNTCIQNKEGMDFASGIHNIITNNTCKENQNSGLYFDTAAIQNNITWNFLVANALTARDQGEDNIFDYNAYSDYTGVDNDNDGIGDTPYHIPGLAGNQDLHPLMRFIIPTTTPTTTSTTPPIPGFPIEAILIAFTFALSIGIFKRHQASIKS